MNDTVQRVAQAMAEATNGGDWRDNRWYTEYHRKLWQERARVAIKTMREPAGARGLWSDEAIILYQRMIDAALTDGERT